MSGPGGTSVLSMSLELDAFAPIAIALRLADGSSHAPNAARLEGWLRFVPRSMYTSRVRGWLVWVVHVCLPTVRSRARFELQGDPF